MRRNYCIEWKGKKIWGRHTDKWQWSLVAIIQCVTTRWCRHIYYYMEFELNICHITHARWSILIEAKKWPNSTSEIALSWVYFAAVGKSRKATSKETYESQVLSCISQSRLGFHFKETSRAERTFKDLSNRSMFFYCAYLNKSKSRHQKKHFVLCRWSSNFQSLMFSKS